MADGEPGSGGAESFEEAKERAGGSGWTSAAQAARALDCSERTIRRYVNGGQLEGRKVQRGSRRAFEIEIDSLTRLRDLRVAEGGVRDIELEKVEPEDETGGGRSESLERAITNLFDRTEERALENGKLRERLAISELAESTRQAEISDLEDRADREARLRAEADDARHKIEQERDELRRELEEERAEQENRGFWSRLFGG